MTSSSSSQDGSVDTISPVKLTRDLATASRFASREMARGAGWGVGLAVGELVGEEVGVGAGDTVLVAVGVGVPVGEGVVVCATSVCALPSPTVAVQATAIKRTMWRCDPLGGL